MTTKNGATFWGGQSHLLPVGIFPVASLSLRQRRRANGCTSGWSSVGNIFLSPWKRWWFQHFPVLVWEELRVLQRFLMSKQRRRVESWGEELPGVGMPTQKQGDFLKPFACLILPKVCFSVPGRFAISGWFCHLLPEIHLISISFPRWSSPGETSCCVSPACSRSIQGLDWHTGWIPVLCPWALHHLEIHPWMVTVRGHPLCWGRGTHHNLVWELWIDSFSSLLTFGILFF